MSFQLDTSGLVRLHDRDRSGLIGWEDLSPFAQGYVEAAIQELLRQMRDSVTVEYSIAQMRAAARFDALACETVVRIIADCELAQQYWPLSTTTARDGGVFWTQRQHMTYSQFSPLTPELRDGKVYLSD